MTSIPVLIGAGVVIGVLYGLFGVGSAFATPLLSVLGIPAVAAVASPLPALSPGSAAGGWSYARLGLVDARLARRTLVAAVPACILGALASRWVGGPWLLVLSGLMLTIVGVRILVPVRSEASPADPAELDSTELDSTDFDSTDFDSTELDPSVTGPSGIEPERGMDDDGGTRTLAGVRPRTVAVARRDRIVLVTVLGAFVGFAAGLLSNGGGFVLVPMFLLALGLTLPEATATSLVVATVLSIPTVVTHTLLGDIDWGVAVPFAVGLIPASMLGARCAPRLRADRLRAAFGVLLVAVGGWFLVRQLRLVGLA